MLIWRRLILESTKILTNFVHVSRHCQEDNQQKVYIMMRWQDNETKFRKYFSQMFSPDLRRESLLSVINLRRETRYFTIMASFQLFYFIVSWAII